MFFKFQDTLIDCRIHHPCLRNTASYLALLNWLIAFGLPSFVGCYLCLLGQYFSLLGVFFFFPLQILRDSWLLIMFASGMQFACLRVIFLFPVACLWGGRSDTCCGRGVSATCFLHPSCGQWLPRDQPAPESQCPRFRCSQSREGKRVNQPH